MCGLLVYYQQKPLDKSIMEDVYRSLQSINHRGPDGEGILLLNTDNGNFIDWEMNSQVDIASYNMILGHKRLAIFDLSEAGHQPMIDDINKCIIIFNGEIYNFIEIRKELEDCGHHFITKTDTEVIIKSYRQWGAECLQKFNGMWAFVLFDCTSRELFISRDRFGIKPLNYHRFDNESWAMFSEEKQLFPFRKYSKEVNYEAVRNLMQYQIIGSNDQTFYKGVFKFGKSNYTIQSPATFSLGLQSTYYSLDSTVNKYKFSEKEKAISEFNSVFHKAMDFTLRSDVPVGLGFSGGVDSSRIVYESYRYFQKPETFSAVFPGQKVDESKYIELVKNDLGLKSNFCFPEKEFTISDFEKLTYYLDAPVPSSSYYAQWCVSRSVNDRKIKVLLVGQGADEIFAGYHHHFYRYLRSLLLNGRIRLFRNEIESFSSLKNIKKGKLFSIVWNELKLYLKLKLTGNRDIQSKWYMSSTLSQFLKDELLFFQIPFYLQADDRIGMAWHFESRYPFLDHELVNFSFKCSDELKIKDGWQKWLIRQSDNEIPSEISWRKDKIGYIMPEIMFPEFEIEMLNFVKEKTGILSTNNFINYSVGVWLKQQLE